MEIAKLPVPCVIKADCMAMKLLAVTGCDNILFRVGGAMVYPSFGSSCFGASGKVTSVAITL